MATGGSARKKRAHSKEVREKSILMLYNKLNEVVTLLSELLSIQVLTDTAVLHVSTLGVAPFFVEGVSELQLSALKLVTTVSNIVPRSHKPCLMNHNLFCRSSHVMKSIEGCCSMTFWHPLRDYRAPSDLYVRTV